MGVKDTWFVESFIKALNRGVIGFKELSHTHQWAFAKYITLTRDKRRKHRTEPNHAVFYYRELEKSFGRANFKRMNDELQIFTVKNSKHNSQVASAYKLTEQVEKLLNKYYTKGKMLSSRLIYADGTVMHRAPKAIASICNDGSISKAWNGTKTSNAILVDLPMLEKLQKHFMAEIQNGTRDMFADGSNAKIDYRIASIGEIRRLAETDVAGRGVVIHRYRECDSGRLYALNTSLQTAPRSVRSAALHGLHDYDIENCHYSIFYQLAQRAGMECEHINHYLANKSKVRQAVSDNVGITLKQTKSCLLALMYGAKLSEWEGYKDKDGNKLSKGSSIPEEIGRDKAMALYADANFSGIAADVKLAGKLILEQWDKSKTVLFNAMGKSILLSEPSNKKMAHILQGIEAKAIKAAVMLYPDDVVLLMHDGFVSKAILNLQMLEQVIYDETGFKLQVSYEPITVPPDLGL
jgi:hypothetical protein